MENASRDYWTLEAMRKFGGGFVKALGNAGAQADKNNLERLKKAWPEYWKEYEHMGESLRRKKEQRS
ncbi:MAG: hypothetical protein WC763_04650 [Candidatus Paceibacterota bacterium]